MEEFENWSGITEVGEVREWIPAPNGGHIGIVKSEGGDVLTISDEHFRDPSDVARVRVGSRVRYGISRFQTSPGKYINATDMETGESYSTGATRRVELLP